MLERLVDLIEYPPRDRMPCLVIYGSTGMGKTRIIQKFLRDNRAHFDSKLGRTRVPVVSIQMPPAPSERDFYEEILVRMGGDFSYGTSVTTLRHRIRSLARQLQVRMLVIDEIHSLLAGTFREQRIILNAIRFLANDLRIPLVCLGTEEANQALMTDQQLADRFAAAELPPWEHDAGFEQLLLSFESTLPLRRPSEFRDAKLHVRILSLTEGVLGRICRLIEIASVEAIRCGEERICLSLTRGHRDGFAGVDCGSPCTTSREVNSHVERAVAVANRAQAVFDGAVVLLVVASGGCQPPRLIGTPAGFRVAL
jgi:hypothetical protein